jgi:hypothetical protein
MGFCLYVAGSVLIQDVKSGVSIFYIPIERLEMPGFLSHIKFGNMLLYQVQY